jgi:hypothetical protein
MTLYNYIRRRSHDDVTFAEFDRNLNFVPNDILPDVVSRLESYENCSPCRMDFVCNGIANSLMEQ